MTWSNDRGGNGTATGTASWTVSSISLSSGDNKITVTAKDGAGNSGTDTLQVTYSTGSTISAPTVSTGSASSVTTSSATLNGTVNANGASTTAWFNYGITSGSYTGTSSTQSVTGSSNTTVSIGISGLSSNTKYYYRIAASNSGGASYGGESSFTTSTTTSTPTPTPTPTPTTTQFSVTKHLMTYITQDEFNDEYEGCETPPERTTFSDADAQATSWFSYENAAVGDSGKWEWYAPDGTLYGRGSGTYTVTSSCWMSRMAISGKPAASKLGQWQVKVYRNGQNLFTDTFTIQKDTTAPSGSVSINSGASSTNSTAVTLTLSATDNIEVTGYYVSQNSTTPSSSASGWTSVTQSTGYIGGVSYYSGSVSYTLSSGDGSKTVYAWFKDSSGNVSGTASDDITLDTTTPTPTPVASPTLPPFPTPLVSPSPALEGIVFGFVNDEDEQSLEGVSVTIKRVLLAVSHGNISVQAASLIII